MSRGIGHCVHVQVVGVSAELGGVRSQPLTSMADRE